MAFILSTFPGTGKRFFCKEHRNDSIVTVIPPRLSIENSIKKIEEVKSASEVIMTSTNIDLLKAMDEATLSFMLIYPSRILKDEYLKRYKQSGRSELFINQINIKWNLMITELENYRHGQCYHVVLNTGDYIVGTVHPDALPNFLMN